MEHNSPQKEDIERFSVSVPRDIYLAFEEMRKQIGISRSQAIRNAMHLFVEKETQNVEFSASELGEKYTLGTIYLLMKHSQWGITHEHIHEEPHIFSKGHLHSASSLNDADNSGDMHEDNQDHEHNQVKQEMDEEKHEEDGIEESSRYINVLEADVLKNMEIQHEYHDVIVSVTHIHAEHDICLETLIVKGKISRIQSLYSKLRKLRSVIDVRLFIALSH